MLKKFADTDGKLYVYNKNKPESGVFTPNPEKAFRKSHLNTIFMSDGSRNTDLETWYAEQETAISPIIEKIISAGLSHRLSNLSNEEKLHWDLFFYHLHKRSPDIFERTGGVETFNSEYPDYVAEFEKNYHAISDEKKLELDTPEAKQQILHNAKVLARSHTNPVVMSLLDERGVAIGVVFDEAKSLIIGDHPMARLGPGHLANSETELWLPLSCRIAIAPYGPRGSEKIFYFNRDQVRVINEIIFRNSNIVAGRSEQLIRSLARI